MRSDSNAMADGYMQEANACALPATLHVQCLAPTYLGDFAHRGAALRQKGLNRIGNMLVPNSNYCKFEDWVMPILAAMYREQAEDGVRWTPSKVRILPCDCRLWNGIRC